MNNLVATNEFYYKKISESVINRDTSNRENFDYVQSLLGKLLAKTVQCISCIIVIDAANADIADANAE